MNKGITLVLVLTVLGLIAACRTTARTLTPVPPTANVPTALPPAPTAPPLTAAPTAVLPTQAPPPTATIVSPTTAPTIAPTTTPANPTTAPTITPTTPPTNPTTTRTGTTNPTASTSGSNPAPRVDRGALTGLFVTNLRHEPADPRTNDPVLFYATLVNRTGKEQHYPVCAEIFRPDAKKSFGITNCENLTIVPGTAQLFIGSWIGSGIKECIPVRARAVLREADEDDLRLVFTTVNGGELWTDFNVCP